jgi:hypothetical protein
MTTEPTEQERYLEHAWWKEKEKVKVLEEEIRKLRSIVNERRQALEEVEK